GGADEVAEQHRELAPLAFGRWRSDPRLGRAVQVRPGKRLAVAHRHAPDLDQLRDQRVQGVGVEVELALQRAQRDTLLFLEQRLGPVDLVDEAHWISRAALFQRTFPVTPAPLGRSWLLGGRACRSLR